ncbi:MAG: tRNA pseudouridine(13) synthase TruD [Thermoplasmata archaeon]|nr:tRNA pseudouridine(13) synthase TruD [Thermoplasmata archaeon]
MGGTAWEPPQSDRSLGLGFYATQSPGVTGVLKSRSEDFVVREISSYPVPVPDGPFTVLRVASRDWEQHELAERIAERLHLPPHAVSWAGTKDRRALAERLLSYRGPLPEGPLGLRDVEVTEAYRARDGLSLGHHYGNGFDIRIEILGEPLPSAFDRLRTTRLELLGLGGFPNFFGLQRFGEVRPMTHEVGRALVRGDPEAAVEVYLTWLPVEGEVLGAEARRSYAEHHDAARALSEFPREFRFERVLLDHLAKGHDASRALRGLSRELRLLFIHAYQSWLFNRWLTARHDRGISLLAPVPGDRILRQLKDGTVSGKDAVPVGADNLPECVDLVGRGRARLAGPLVGYDTPPLEGEAGELLERLLEEEGVTREKFRLPKNPEVSSAGAYRPAWIPIPPIALRLESAKTEAATTPRGGGVWLTFALPKGCYATVLLREFLKSGAVEGVAPASQTQS